MNVYNLPVNIDENYHLTMVDPKYSCDAYHSTLDFLVYLLVINIFLISRAEYVEYIISPLFNYMFPIAF